MPTFNLNLEGKTDVDIIKQRDPCSDRGMAGMLQQLEEDTSPWWGVAKGKLSRGNLGARASRKLTGGHGENEFMKSHARDFFILFCGDRDPLKDFKWGNDQTYILEK